MEKIDWNTPVLKKADGTTRRVGVEIEMGGISMREVTEIASRWANVDASLDSLAEGHINTKWGKLATEVDWNYLKKAASADDLDPSRAKWLQRLETVANVVVPTEIALPPIPLDELHEIESLVDALRAAGAKGTGHSALAAYGLHLNPELPDLEPATLVGFIQAFGLLQWWLVEAYQVDFTRRISPYIDLYPQTYILTTLSYDPRSASIHRLRHDYLMHNPTRNRALDLWPLFAFQDPDWVKQRIGDEKVKARPTLHFRLPNSEIDKPGWRIWHTWKPWSAVEHLAHDTALRAELAAEFDERQRPVLGAKRADWVEYLDQWLKDRSLA